MRQHPSLPLEADAYLDVVVSYNQAIGHCLGYAIETGRGYDEACERLLNCDWPADALLRAPAYAAQFPDLPALFEARRPQESLPGGLIWEEVRQDLFRHAEYQRVVRIRSRRYRRQITQRGLTLLDLYIECLPRISRQLLGRAAVWQEGLIEYRRAHPETTWLQWALNWSRHEVGRAIREHLGMRIRNEAGGEATPGPGLRFTPETDLLGSDSGAIRPTEQVESRELPPDVQAELAERKRIVREAMERLSPDERELIESKAERTFAEIDLEMGWKAGTAKQRYRQALEHLRRELGDAFGPRAG